MAINHTSAPNHLDIVADPAPSDLADAQSCHVFAFTGAGELLVAESEGEFDLQTWEGALAEAERICLGAKEARDSDGMEVEDGEGREESVMGWVRTVAEEKVEREGRWRNGS